MQFDEFSSFLDLDTGKVETVSLELLHEVEESGDDDDEDPEGEDEDWEIAKRIVAMDCVLKLPTKFDVHDWAIMEEFSRSAENARIRGELLDAIHGAGAFSNFKSTLRRHHIEEAWYAFRTDALKEIAIAWCEEHHITWE